MFVAGEQKLQAIDKQCVKETEASCKGN